MDLFIVLHSVNHSDCRLVCEHSRQVYFMFAELAGFFFAVDAQDADEFIIFNERSSQGSEQVFFFNKFQIAEGLKLEVWYYHGLYSHASFDSGIDFTCGQ